MNKNLVRILFLAVIILPIIIGLSSISERKKIKGSVKSKDFYEKAIAKNPDDTDAYYGLAYIYYHEEKYDESLKALRKVVEIDPDYTSAYKGILCI